MPITYRIDPGLGLVLRRFEGETTAEDFERHWRELMSDPELPAEGPLLLVADMCECEFRLYGEDVHQIVNCVIEPLLAGRRWVSALVVSSSTQRGVANQFMVYSERCGVTQMFRDMDEATRWVAEFRLHWATGLQKAFSGF